MTQDEIIEMAVQAGMAEEIAAFNIPIIEAFAKLVAAKAIAELESQEPVAWAVYCDGFIALPSFDSELEARQEMQRRNRKFPHNKRKVKALYDTPPQRTWVGLTNEEIDSYFEDHGYSPSEGYYPVIKDVEAKFKERNT